RLASRNVLVLWGRLRRMVRFHDTSQPRAPATYNVESQLRPLVNKELVVARIRHIALVVKDLEATADFYVKAFGLKRSPLSEGPTARRIYLSDGHVNLALLQYKGEHGSGLKDAAGYVGVHHFGFQVDDIEQQQKIIEDAGGKFFFDLGKPEDDDFERKFRDPNGIIFDINWKGWTLTSGKIAAASSRSAAGGLSPAARARRSPAPSRKAAARRPRPARAASRRRSARRASR
ncbi:MAG TPA: VOC family protein, partial [Burkholderiales bacterium]|nr:VOC family protein [Burkholderiales bacterium]